MTLAPLTAASFVATLAQFPSLPNVFNPWRDYDPLYDNGVGAPCVRAMHLTRYLAERARAGLILVAEAPGYQGCRFSGIAMTDERSLLGHKPGRSRFDILAVPSSRSSVNQLAAQGMVEPTATVVWAAAAANGLNPRGFVLWNAFPFHPHQPGEPLSNRTPTRSEIQATHSVLPQLLGLYPNARVVAVGRVAQGLLGQLNIDAPALRHPARGGATAFREGLAALVR